MGLQRHGTASDLEPQNFPTSLCAIIARVLAAINFTDWAEPPFSCSLITSACTRTISLGLHDDKDRPSNASRTLCRARPQRVTPDSSTTMPRSGR